MKYLIVIIAFFISFPIISALELGISPIELKFEGNAGEKICKNYTLFVEDFSGFLIGETKWAKIGEIKKDLKIHTLNAESLGITLEYQKNINLHEKTSFEICILCKTSGNYHGALLYQAEGTNLGVGNWIILKINENNLKSNLQSNSKIAMLNNKKIKSSFNFLILSPTIFLFFVFILLFKLKRKEKQDFYSAEDY